ncbi:RidA family protein [Streptomyces nigra]|uniref:RidA family protein n=1 Tax=Streptomyces nigra TaxID=1827580 RepID=UPI0036B77BF9
MRSTLGRLRSVGPGFRAEVVSGHTRTLYCSGQTAMDAEGKPRHEGDMAAQLALSPAGVAPATTMLGVARLAVPGQLVELEGTAVA